MQFKVAKDKIDAYYVYYRLYAQDSGGQRRYQSEPNYTRFLAGSLGRFNTSRPSIGCLGICGSIISMTRQPLSNMKI